MASSQIKELNQHGFRKYYNYTLDDLLKEELAFYTSEHFAIRNAKQRRRMYANLFTRDVRKIVLTKESECIFCSSKINLEIDHIIPVSKGGKNEIENTQILCESCNLKKRNNG